MPGLLQLLNGLSLILELCCLILNLSDQSFNFARSLSKLVLCSLQISLRPETHISDLVQTVLVLLLNLFDLILCIIMDLLHGLSIVFLQ